MKFTKSFSEMQDEINEIFIQHDSYTRVKKISTTGRPDASCIFVVLDSGVNLKELEEISILTGDDDILVDGINYDTEIIILPEKWIDDSRS